MHLMTIVVGLAGWSGSGKTTLIAQLIPVLVERGYSVSTVKHAHHTFDIDQPGKDSWIHRQAGAREVIVASADRFALLHELRGDKEPSLVQLLGRLAAVDIVLVEGFRGGTHSKIEVHRAELGRPLLCSGDREIVAVASSEPLNGVTVPCLPLEEVGAIADFILAFPSWSYAS